MGGPKVAVAISGGVDSSLSAALLKEAGCEVVGMVMKLWPDRFGCSGSTQDHLQDAQEVCRLLDIPLHVINLEEEFRGQVLDYLCGEYARGRTPNPCAVCNQRIKFGLLLDQAFALGARFLATGHYARIDREGERYRLLRGADAESDQSYFLYTLGQEQLSRLMFPVGTYGKSEVRRFAAERGLPAARKRKSQDLCFVADGRFQEFLKEHVPSLPGPVVDVEGRRLGMHRGLAFYTIGQRTGLGIAAGKRVFVLALDADSNTIVVGPEEDLNSSALLARQASFVGGGAEIPLSVEAKVRYRAPAARAVLYPHGTDLEVEFEAPQRAVASGQAVVFYRGEEVVGGGIIEATWTGCRRSMVKMRSGPSDTG